MSETTMIIMLVVYVSSNILCFFIGARVGQKVVNGEVIKAPNPVKMMEERKESIELAKEKEIMEINLENIDSYDGTGFGQRDFD